VRRSRVVWIVAVVLAVAAAGGLLWWKRTEDAAAEARDRRAARERRAREARATMQRAERYVSQLVTESRTLMPAPLRGIALGITITEARRARRGALQPARNARDRDKIFFEELLPSGAQVLYGFDIQSQRLIQVQVLSLLPGLEAIGPHLTAMHEHYGRPTGIWDCPSAEGAPTRRFTWRRSVTSMADIFLVYANRVSLTLYIAPSEVIGTSLQRAACRPVTPDRLAQFPIADAAALGARAQQKMPARAPRR